MGIMQYSSRITVVVNVNLSLFDFWYCGVRIYSS